MGVILEEAHAENETTYDHTDVARGSIDKSDIPNITGSPRSS